MPHTIIGKTNQPDSKKRFTQVMQADCNRVVKKPKTKY